VVHQELELQPTKCVGLKVLFAIVLIAAIEQAISDGVDIISLSLGSSTITDSQGILKDMISIGAFHALARNILLVASAGNDGPTPGSVTNVAPWVFTVAASTIDRDFSSTMTIGNKTVTVIFWYSLFLKN
jgi:subtilisin family serine protease